MEPDRTVGLLVERLRIRLKEARQMSKLSQAEVANKLGVSRPTISYLETGIQELTLWWFCSLCHLYGESAWSMLQSEQRALAVDLATERDEGPEKARRKPKIVDGSCVDG